MSVSRRESTQKSLHLYQWDAGDEENNISMGRQIVYLLLVARPGQEAVAVVVVGFVLVVFVWFILRSLPRGVVIRPPQQKLRQKLRDEYHAPQFSALTSYAKLTFGCTSAHKKRD